MLLREAFAIDEAGRVTHTFGARLAKANAKNAAVSDDPEVHRAGVEKYEKLMGEIRSQGDARKDARGAWPKDVLRAHNRALKQRDFHRQHLQRLSPK